MGNVVLYRGYSCLGGCGRDIGVTPEFDLVHKCLLTRQQGKSVIGIGNDDL